jgi:DNA replication protein DnaC
MKRPLRTHLSPLNLTRRGIPKNMQKNTIKDFDSFGNKERAKIGKLIKDYINNIDDKFENNIGLFLFGSNGTGKTYLASIIVKEAYRHRYTSKRCTFVNYINEYTRVWGTKNKEEKEEAEGLFYNDFKAVEFLCLEELGKEIDTSISVPILEDLLRYREEHGLPIIICTNISPKDLLEKYGSSIMSLIKGNTVPIKMVGQDLRESTFKKRGLS